MRSIREIAPKIKAHSRTLADTILGEWGLFILVILAVAGAFGLGQLSVHTKPDSPILVQNEALGTTSGAGVIAGAYLGSKTGDLYYFPWCTDAAKIAPEMRRWFVSEAAAQKAGYTPATNCRGMDRN